MCIRDSTAYWYRNIGSELRLIALDTVNRFGGWQGCLHREQFEWLSHLLDESKDKYVVLASHHPLENLFNGYVPEEESAPALEEEVRRLLEKHPNVILWSCTCPENHTITLGCFSRSLRTSSSSAGVRSSSGAYPLKRFSRGWCEVKTTYLSLSLIHISEPTRPY